MKSISYPKKRCLLSYKVLYKERLVYSLYSQNNQQQSHQKTTFLCAPLSEPLPCENIETTCFFVCVGQNKIRECFPPKGHPSCVWKFIYLAFQSHFHESLPTYLLIIIPVANFLIEFYYLLVVLR